ncbi:uncharacterized protein LOC144020326 [Festucalex cinctus]
MPAANVTTPSANVTTPATNVTPASILTTPSATTAPSGIIATTAPAQPRVNMRFSLNQTFTPQLSNQSSSEFQTLAARIVNQLNEIYRRRFPRTFIGSRVRSLRRGSVVVDSELLFNSSATVPNDTSVENTLVEAASNNSNSNFSLPLNVCSSNNNNGTFWDYNNCIIRDHNNCTWDHNNCTWDHNNCTWDHNNCTWDHNNGTYWDYNCYSSLTNTFSPTFQSLASAVVSEVNAACTSLFGSSFSRSLVNTFTNGSIVTNMILVFDNQSVVPSASSATAGLTAQLANSSLNIVPGTLSADASRPVVFSLATISLTLLALALMRQDL